MKTIEFLKTGIILFGLIFFAPLFSKAQSKAAYYNFEIEHIKSNDGIETLKIYSFEKNQSKGIEQGKINSIKAILFKGIPNSQNTKPLIKEYGAEEKYKKYFNDFFKKDGKYLKFISLSSNPSDITKEGNKLKVGIIVTIQKDNLRKELEASNIIKALNNGF
jgi:hypothetical protein